MAIATARDTITPLWLGVWALIGLAAAWFLNDSIIYVASREPQPGSTFLNRQLWYLAHMAIATPILVIAPIQFIARIRQSRPQVHRWLGRAFLAASILAGLLAIWLGATIQYEGSKLPLAMFGALWIFFSYAAWICARKGDFPNHRKFVILASRSDSRSSGYEYSVHSISSCSSSSTTRMLRMRQESF